MIPCIIPARGGSKSIPHKNITLLSGKPLIVWSIEQARAAEEIDRVIVATNCDRIADVAREHQAQVYWRSEESATDAAPSEHVLQEVVTELGYHSCEAIVFLQATSPVRLPGEIDRAIGLFRDRQADSLFSGRHVEGYTWRQNDAQLTPLYITRRRRQDEAGETIEENGSIYIFQPRVLLETGNRLGGKVVCHKMHTLDSWQVDEFEDIPLIERIMEVRLGCQPQLSA